MKLADVIAECAVEAATEASPPIAPQDQPWWVVVVNPRRQPPRPKFVAGFATEAEAIEDCGQRQEQAKHDAHERTRELTTLEKAKAKGMAAMGVPVPEQLAVFEPFRFFAIERPEGGSL